MTIVDVRFLDLDAFDDDGNLIRPMPLTPHPWDLAEEGGQA